MSTWKKQTIRLLPILSILLALVLYWTIPDAPEQPVANGHYYEYFLYLLLGLYGIFWIISFFWKKLDEKITYKAPLWAGTILFINIVDLITQKFALLPVLFFPSLDRVFGVYVTDASLLGRCILSSFKLLILGFLYGAVIGFICGLLIGFSKKFLYWVMPFTKFIGPIPPTSWSPLVLSLFSTSYKAAIFMVALAVWFPVTLMTASGIQNVSQSYFEVASTLGGGKWNKVFKVGVPAALDNGGVDAIGIHDPVATTAERSYNFRKILDVGTDAKFKNEYCCQAFVSGDLYKYNPEGAAAYTRAIQKAAAFIEAEPYEAAKLQIQKGYMPGPESENAQNNGDILAGFNFTPSVSLGRKTFESSFKDLQKTGDIPKTLDEKEFQAKVYPTLKGVPDSYTYDPGTKTFKEVKSSSGTKADSAIGVEAQARTPARTTAEHKEQNDCCA